MVFAGTCRKPSRFALNHSALICVKLNQLVRALPHLPLFVEHKATAKGIYLVVVGDRRVALASLHRLRGHVRNPLPNYLVTVNLGLDDLTARIIIETSNQV